MPAQVSIHDPVRAKEFFEAKMAFTTGPVELERMMKSGEVNVVDVRAAEDYAAGHIPGAVNLPNSRLSRSRRDCMVPHEYQRAVMEKK